MSNRVLNRGDIVTVIAFGGRKLHRRVWEDIGDVILICTEEEYQRALRFKDEATCSGFPKDTIVEVHGKGFSESA